MCFHPFYVSFVDKRKTRHPPLPPTPTLQQGMPINGNLIALMYICALKVSVISAKQV
jgi:hypothetical protein